MFFDWVIERGEEDVEVRVEVLDYYRGHDGGYWEDGGFYDDDPSEVWLDSWAEIVGTGKKIQLTESELNCAERAFWAVFKG